MILTFPIYAAGREHPYKEPCVRVLTMVAQHPLAFVTSVEVLQEIVHYYHASRRWELGREVLRSFSEIMHERIEPVYEWDIYFAASLAELQPHISTRGPLTRSGDEPSGIRPDYIGGYRFRPTAGDYQAGSFQSRGMEQRFNVRGERIAIMSLRQCRSTLKLKVLPLPSSVSTPTSPPCACTICRTIASPNPLPPSRRARSTL